MPGTVDYEPAPVPPSRPPVVALVYRYDPDAEDEDARYELMPNVRLLEVHEQRGPHPAAARLRYAFDEVATLLDPDVPDRAEKVWGLTAENPYVFQMDDRAVCRVYDPSAEDVEDYAIAFDGHVGYPQLDLGGDREAVTAAAYGRPVRLWDAVLRWVHQRHADDAADGATARVPLRVRFNPEGRPNCTAVDHDENAGDDDAHPAFLDVLVATGLEKKTPKGAAFWSVSGAVRYLLFTENADETFVKNPTSDAIKELFDAWLSVTGDDDDINPEDPDTFIAFPVELPDLDVTGDTLPVALQKVIEPHGFAFRFVISKTAADEESEDPGGDPEWRIQFYRTDTDAPRKSLRLAAARDDLDLTRSNTQSVSLARDGEVMNAWAGLTAPTVVEAGFTLAPLFDVAIADADSLLQWVEGDSHFDGTKYREFGVDETGEGHWTTDAGTSHEAPDLSAVLGTVSSDGTEVYVVRRRPGRNRLVTKVDDAAEHKTPDSAKERRPTALYVSADYAGPKPGVWDGTGVWQEVAHGHGWELLETRLGVKLTMTDPENWNIGGPAVNAAAAIGGGPSPYPGGLVSVVTGTAAPTEAEAARAFTLMLVTVVETDETLGTDPGTTLHRREASPVGFQILRADEVRDRFVHELRHESSPWKDAAGGRWQALRDDTKKLKAHLSARRRAHELAVVAGTALIPRVTFSYNVGDRITGVTGRRLDFLMNIVSGGEAPVYPVVEGITWTYEDRQQTSLSLSDRRADAPPEKRT